VTNTTEILLNWMNDHPTATIVIKYLFLVVLVLLMIGLLRRLLRRKLPDTEIRYKSQKAVEVLGYFLIIIMSVSYFTGNIKDFALAIGLLTAGITITLQELILSIAGSFYIYFVKVYKPGDRIEINGIKGDVIDIDSIYTTMMEIGEWVSSDNYSGRIIKLSNAFVFRGPVYNYSSNFPFVWDELNIPVRYGSDTEKAKQIFIEVANEVLFDYVRESVEKWNDVVNRYYIENAQVEPTIAITMTDNWINFNLRYIVDYRKRRSTHHILNDLIGKRVKETEGAVTIASATIEVVRIPDLRVDEKRSGQ
jgi:small-conductance mechanosensitive channel